MKNECRHIYAEIQWFNGDIELRCIKCGYYIVLRKNGEKREGYYGKEEGLQKSGKVHNRRV
jgi:hypothetical protein